MITSAFIGVNEVKELLGISKSRAYGVIHDLNEELKTKGYLVVSGRVSRIYFNERFFGMIEKEEDNASE